MDHRLTLVLPLLARVYTAECVCVAGRRVYRQPATVPPSRTRAWPTMNAAPCEQRSAAAGRAVGLAALGVARV